MSVYRFVASIVLVLALSSAVASADVVPWDAAKTGALAKQLVTATTDLYDTFYKQPVPTQGSGQSRAYQRLKQKVRRLQSEARELSGAIEKGEGQEQTLPIYEDLMQVVRDAREDARQVFTGVGVSEKAAVARGLLNQLGPYYDPDYEALAPVTR